MKQKASHYQGTELSLFSEAVRWKRYWSSKVRPFLGTRVLEVGAGIGGSTPYLCTGREKLWRLVEPDAQLAAQLKRKVEDGLLPSCCDVYVGTLDQVSCECKGKPTYDSILYIDVLEHIEDDRGELERASSLLLPGGRLIALMPAFHFLYSEFDRSIGHFRRYDARHAARLTPPGLELVSCSYLDSVGFPASLGNRILLRSPMPTREQILFWDRYLVPASRFFDKIFNRLVGRSILAIWQRGPEQ